METTTCPRCANDVKAEAFACPHCGGEFRRMKANGKMRFPLWVHWLLAGILVVIVVAAMAG